MLKRIRKYIYDRYRGIEENEINYNKAIGLQKKGAILLDVRSPKEYSEGHLNGAILLPEYEIKQKVLQMIPNKDKEIIVYCKSGVRGKNAAYILKQLGYKNIYNFHNGLYGINM